MSTPEKFFYDNKIVKYFLYATVLWGVVGMVVGLLIAFQLVDPSFNLGNAYTTFGRARPIHTNAIIFAFVGNGIFMGVYYSMQRVLRTRMFSDTLSYLHFWGWQAIIVAAALTLAMGYTTGKEYAELEWPIDIAIAVVWVIFGINMMGTIIKRRESHIYVAVWFYIASWITVAMLHIVNSFELPISFLKSYSWYAGVQDALVQWWYGHNAVAFFLTTPYLGVMYYFLPKAAERPIYSYRLSIVHFWSLIFLYIWAGPHHLLYTALPDWAQSLGTVFSVMLIAPSWGGMMNGLLTLRGVWDKVKDDPILKFMVVAVTCYGMATFEGPMLSLKNVNAFGHYTDWIVGHVHIGGLGWNGFLTFGILYWLVPRMWKTEIHSKSLANVHFWIGTLGILVYALPLYFSGITQTLMSREFTEDGVLKYSFLQVRDAVWVMQLGRGIGGTLYLTGVLIMVFNLWKTIAKGSFIANEAAEGLPLSAKVIDKPTDTWHRRLEARPVQMLILSLIAVAIGGIVEFVPAFLVKSNVPTIASVKPYTPLELEGRDIYIREGCYTCHSQMVRPFRHEVSRFGEYSKAGEFVYDHPFQWGSKRTGPDLHRIGTRYNEAWHYKHFYAPSSMAPGSVMPSYTWLYENDLDVSQTAKKIEAMRTLGVPYEPGYEKQAVQDLQEQAKSIVQKLQQQDKSIQADPKKEIIALIAYMQRLGTDIFKKEEQNIGQPSMSQK